MANQVKGRYLEDVWYESVSSEVHIKAKHVPLFPWGDSPELPSRNEPYQYCHIEVAELCHVTHLEQFQQIKQTIGRSTRYELKPLMKMGKEGYMKDGYLIGASYTPSSPAAVVSPSYRIMRCTPYRRVTPDEPILPGYYIWWSANLRYRNTSIDEKCDEDYTYSDVFSDPPTSLYGSKKISVMSYHILRSYQEAFAHGGKYPRLEFRNGGTLRYKHEICYVVIVCVQGQFGGVLDYQYPQEEGFPIKYNNHDGRISFVNKWKITIRNGIKAIGRDIFSWDHYVLAFHYPNGQMRMILQKESVRVEDVEHDFCVKRRCIDGEFMCPDDVINL